MTILSESDLETMFDDMLDETNERVKIGQLEYLPSDVLRSVDPVAHRCGFVDWLDSEISEGNVFEDDEGNYHDQDPNK